MTKYIAPKNETYLSAEIAYTKGDKIDRLSFQKIKSIVEKDLLKVGVIKNKKEPVTCIIGGSKISSKINIIKNLIPKFNSIIIVGAMANNISKYKGLKIGNSVYEKNIDCEKTNKIK